MDDQKTEQLILLTGMFVSPFLNNGKNYQRIFVVSADEEARKYVVQAIRERLTQSGRKLNVVATEGLPEGFTKGQDYAIGLDYYLARQGRRAWDLGELLE